MIKNEMERVEKRHAKAKLKKKAAKLLGIGERVNDVAQKIGVTRQCIQRWRCDPDFNRISREVETEYNKFKQSIMDVNE